MAYVDIPETHKTIYSTIYPNDYQYNKPIQIVKPDKTKKYSTSIAASSTASSVYPYNPSTIKSGMLCYNTPGTILNNKTGLTRYATASGRIVEVEPETLQPTKKIGHNVYLNTSFFNDGPDFIDRDEKHLKEVYKKHFDRHNVFQTEEYITSGEKAIVLESGRVVKFNVDENEVEKGRCARPDKNMVEVKPNEHAFNLDVWDGPDVGVREYVKMFGGGSSSVKDDGYEKDVKKEDINKEGVKTDIRDGVKGDVDKTDIYKTGVKTDIYKTGVKTDIYKTDVKTDIYKTGVKTDVNKDYKTDVTKYIKPDIMLQKPQMIIPTDPLKTDKGEISYKNFSMDELLKSKESFGIPYDMSDELYKQILKTSAKAICDWLLSFKPYRPWMEHWKILESNLKKTDLNISKLSTDDKEIAYTLDKGEIIKFRWQDKKRYIPKDVFMYVLLHELTHESFPKEFQGHDEPFPQMLCLLCVAATEIGLMNIENIPKNMYMSNDRPITSRESIKGEVMFGIDMLIEANKGDVRVVEYYEAKRKYAMKWW